MTDTRTFDQKLSDPAWRERAHEVIGHVETLIRMAGPGQVIARRQYLEALEAKDPEMRANVAFSFDYRWRTEREPKNGFNRY